MPISESSRNQAIHGSGGVIELLVRRVAVARLHFGHQPAVVTHFGHRAADGGPVVVTKKQIGVHTLVATRSEEHTSELQSRLHLVCRLLLEKKKKKLIN